MASTSPANFTVVDSPESLQSLLSADLTRVSVLYFRADWAEPCTQMDQVVQELAKRWQNVLFLSVSWLNSCTSTRADLSPSPSLSSAAPHTVRLLLYIQIEAEALPDISESFEVDAVPYFILLRVSPSLSLFLPFALFTDDPPGRAGSHAPHPPLGSPTLSPLRRSHFARFQTRRAILHFAEGAGERFHLYSGRGRGGGG